MALEQSGPTARRLRRTDAARTLDPSEKGAVNYFLGMTICKLFSAQLLQAPWVMHLDVFRPQINPVLRKRSRPDLVGQTVSNEWVVIESKGRISIPSADAKNKAKEQAEQLTMVNGIPPRFQIGGIAFFRNEVLRFFWRDPEPEPRNRRGTFDVKLGDDDWSYYFRPVLELIHSQPHYFEQMRREEILMPVNGLDINVGIHPLILSLLAEEKWSDARRLCYEKNKGLIDAGYQADGIRVVAGDTWLSPLVEFNKSR